MSDVRTPTEQETAIYDALYAGDHAAIEQMRQDAYSAGEGDQFEIDYYNAWTHYQADHEPPEAEREAATQAAVETENELATPDRQ